MNIIVTYTIRERTHLLALDGAAPKQNKAFSMRRLVVCPTNYNIYLNKLFK